MKYITFAVPCYNSESYMEHCIETLLTGGEDVEIILVNDGSKDNTKKIADKYQKKYPFAKNIEYNDIMDSIEIIINLLEKEEVKA